MLLGEGVSVQASRSFNFMGVACVYAYDAFDMLTYHLPRQSRYVFLVFKETCPTRHLLYHHRLVVARAIALWLLNHIALLVHESEYEIMNPRQSRRITI